MCVEHYIYHRCGHTIFQETETCRWANRRTGIAGHEIIRHPSTVALSISRPECPAARMATSSDYRDCDECVSLKSTSKTVTENDICGRPPATLANPGGDASGRTESAASSRPIFQEYGERWEEFLDVYGTRRRCSRPQPMGLEDFSIGKSVRDKKRVGKSGDSMVENANASRNLLYIGGSAAGPSPTPDTSPEYTASTLYSIPYQGSPSSQHYDPHDKYGA
ncbi:hypothetical protein ABW19_dt0204063 [Dactylella cylindrospora]|nr:hypothetical protein ABW19_dt0204063 [Dactylella cylindrospora]